MQGPLLGMVRDHEVIASPEIVQVPCEVLLRSEARGAEITAIYMCTLGRHVWVCICARLWVQMHHRHG